MLNELPVRVEKSGVGYYVTIAASEDTLDRRPTVIQYPVAELLNCYETVVQQ
jgi:hypothetical protein